MNIAQHVEAAANSRPERAAILFEGQAITYGELNRRASQTAQWLEQLGIQSGDRVALSLPNIPEFAIAYLGAQKLGAVVVSLNPTLTPVETEYALSDSGSLVLFTTQESLANLTTIRGSLPALRALISCEGRSADPEHRTLGAAIADFDGSLLARPRAVDAPAAILYTSGTTGKPKGAVLTHRNVISNYRATMACVGSRAGDRHLLYLPLFHCFAQNFIMNAAFGSQGTIVLERRYQQEAVLSAIRRHEVTHFYGVPTVFIYLLGAEITRAQLASVKYFFSAAATMPREVAQGWRERFGLPVFEGYGLTETAPLACYNHRDDYRLGSVGTPIEGVEMKIIDEAGRARATDEWGEICIKGPNVMAEYFQRDQETRDVLCDGWFRTGDIGYCDRDGYYYLVDRLKDMINCAGFKVWPREIEEVLYEHPAVAECAVVGAADPIKGERVVAFVRLHAGVSDDAAALRKHCETRLAAYKLPTQFVLDQEIPKSPAGKILKRVLRGGTAG
jgi:long-chain acyl-CoA synthetase